MKPKKQQSPIKALLWMDDISEEMRLEILLERILHSQVTTVIPSKRTIKAICKERRVGK